MSTASWPYVPAHTHNVNWIMFHTLPIHVDPNVKDIDGCNALHISIASSTELPDDDITAMIKFLIERYHYSFTKIMFVHLSIMGGQQILFDLETQNDLSLAVEF